MAITFSDNIMVGTNKVADAKYGPYLGSGTTYALALANAKDNVFIGGVGTLPLGLLLRYRGLTVALDLTVLGVKQPIVEYWFVESVGTGINPPTSPNDGQFLIEKSGGTTVVANPTTTSSTLTSITIGTTSYAVGGGGTVTGPSGGGTANVLTKWSTGGTGIEDSEISDSGTVVKIGNNSSNQETLHINTDTRSVGFRTTNPQAAFDVNGTMRVRNELNVGATTEQSLFVQGPGTGAALPAYYVKMGSYGQGLITGSPAVAEQTGQNLRRSAAFGNKGKVVDNYIYDTFEVPPAILAGLGTTPLTGHVLVNTPSDQVCVLADFWFYRQIKNNSAIGNWGDDIELVVYPSNDESGQKITPPYEQGYFRVTHDFLSLPATGGSSGASCGFFQGNLNGEEAAVTYGAWQIGDNTNNQPLGNKVYLSLSSNSTSQPTFSTNTQTKFYIGLKYRFLSIEHGIVNNENLIVLGQEKRKFVQCDPASDECQEEMASDLVLYSSVPIGTVVKIQLDSNPSIQCCYTASDELDANVTPGYTLLSGTFVSCAVCQAESPTSNMLLERCEEVSEGCANMPPSLVMATSAILGQVIKVEETATNLECCYEVKNASSSTPTAGYTQKAGPFATCQECIDNVAEAKMYFEECTGQTCGAMPSKFTKTTTLNRGDVVKATDGLTTCCYTVTDLSTDIETRGIVLDRVVSASCDACMKGGAPTVDEYRKCSGVPTGSKDSCNSANTADVVYVTYNSNNPDNAVLVNSNFRGARCCYTKASSGSGTVTSGYSIDTAIDPCGSENLPDECKQ